MPITLTTPPAEEPVSLAEAKAHLRVDAADEHPLISNLIGVARQLVEAWEWRSLVTQTWTLKLREFPERSISVPRPPLQSVTSLTYFDVDGVSRTLGEDKDFRVDYASEPARILPVAGSRWPAVADRPLPVTLVYVAGFGGAAAVPIRAKQAILLVVGHLWCNREAATTERLNVMPFGVDALLDRRHDPSVLPFVV